MATVGLVAAKPAMCYRFWVMFAVLIDLFVCLLWLVVVLAALALGLPWLSVLFALVTGIAAAVWLVAPRSWRDWLE